MLNRCATILCIAAAVVIAQDHGAATRQDEPRVVEITAKRFAFDPPMVEAVAGESLRLVIKSADGPHGLELKAFKVKKEIPRGGNPVIIELTPTEPGQYPILCSTYCGDGHGDMKGMLVVTARTSP